MKILLIGFGKINKLIYKEYENYIVGVIDKDEKYIKDSPEIIIDFSHPDMLDETIFYACKYQAPLLIGTTGYNEEKMAKINQLSNFVPVLKSNNFSLGIYLINKIIKENNFFINSYDKKIIETHHMDKFDNISGTAIMLGETLKTKNITSQRLFDNLGKHTIVLTSDSEEIVISHNTLDRKAFIVGVIKAIDWLVKQKPNLYGFEDIFNEV